MTALAATSRAGWTAALGGSLLLHAGLAVAVLPLLDDPGRRTPPTDISFSEPPPDVVASLPQRSETLAPAAQAAETVSAAEAPLSEPMAPATAALSPVGSDAVPAAAAAAQAIPQDAPPSATLPLAPGAAVIVAPASLPESLPAEPAAQPSFAQSIEASPAEGVSLALPAPTAQLAASAESLGALSPEPQPEEPRDQAQPALQAGTAEAASVLGPLDSTEGIALNALSALPPSEAGLAASAAQTAGDLLPNTPVVAMQPAGSEALIAATSAQPASVVALDGEAGALVVSPEAAVSSQSAVSPEIVPAPSVLESTQSLIPSGSTVQTLSPTRSIGTSAGTGIAPAAAPEALIPSPPPLQAAEAAAPEPPGAAVLEPLPQAPEVLASAPQAAAPAAAAAAETSRERQAEQRRQAVAFVKTFRGGGDCFAVVPAQGSGDAVGFDAFSRDGRAMRQFAEAALALGPDTSTSFGALSAPQCSALVFARGQRNYPDFSLGLTLDGDSIPDHADLIGRVSGAAAGPVRLLLIDDEGTVQSLDRFLSAEAEPSFRIPMNLTDGQVQTKQLLIALTADKPLRMLEGEVTEKAPVYFRQLQAESRIAGAKLDLALRAFSIGAESGGAVQTTGEVKP